MLRHIRGPGDGPTVMVVNLVMEKTMDIVAAGLQVKIPHNAYKNEAVFVFMRLNGRVGIALSCYGDPAELIRMAKRAEGAGFNRAWFIEVQDVDAFVMSCAAALSTKTIGVATGVTNSHLRLPTTIAMAAATTSLLSDGRFSLGIGAGVAPMGYAETISSDRPITRLRETLIIINELLRTGRCTFSGKLFNVNGFELYLRPRSRIPVYAAGMGPRAIELAAGLTDGVLVMLPTAEHMSEARRIADKAGTSARVIGYFLTVAEGDGSFEKARRAIAEYCTYPAFGDNFKRLGYGKTVEAVKSAAAAGIDAAMQHVPRKMVDDLMIYGTSGEIENKIKGFFDAGADEVVLYPYMTGQGDYPSGIEHVIDAVNM
ncbi:MAG: LLM class flavin-dependent oxidoreductase [Nitrososphaerota archaeon]|nr:LLM class flavin-dependent oxidoreductase [Nitrososphaerota archaeon]